MELCKVTVQDLEESKKCQVEIIDGYHRYGALMLIRQSPERLLSKEIAINWKEMAAIYPSWITMDRYLFHKTFLS